MSLREQFILPLLGLNGSLNSIVRELFEKYSALLFCDQTFLEETHIKFAQLFGPLENRDAMATKKNIKFEIPKVSNEDGEGSVFDESDLKTLDLKGNMLWHTDSTFLPIPALANIIAAKVIPSSGGQTVLASTRVALRDLPIGIYKKIEGRKIYVSADLWEGENRTAIATGIFVKVDLLS